MSEAISKRVVGLSLALALGGAGCSSHESTNVSAQPRDLTADYPVAVGTNPNYLETRDLASEAEANKLTTKIERVNGAAARTAALLTAYCEASSVYNDEAALSSDTASVNASIRFRAIREVYEQQLDQHQVERLELDINNAASEACPDDVTPISTYRNPAV